MKWLQMQREQKRLKQHRSTRQLMGIRKVLPHGVMTSVGCLVFFQIRPDNLSVLSAEGIRQRVTALGNLFRAEEHVEILALDARESFQQIQAFYQARLDEETVPKVRELLQKDIAYLDEIQAIFDDYIGGNSDNWRKIWTIYTFLVWYEEYFVKR